MAGRIFQQPSAVPPSPMGTAGLTQPTTGTAPSLSMAAPPQPPGAGMNGAVVLRVQRDTPISWAWFPFVLARIARFCEKFDTETEPLEMVDLVRNLFCNGDPRLGLWICIANQQIIGHTLAMPEPFGSEHWKYCLIREAEVDPGVDVRKETEDVFEDVKRWANSIGLSKIMMLTHRNSEAMARRWGFTKYKTVMEMNLDSARADTRKD